jgi:hypothetical protein
MMTNLASRPCILILAGSRVVVVGAASLALKIVGVGTVGIVGGRGIGRGAVVSTNLKTPQVTALTRDTPPAAIPVIAAIDSPVSLLIIILLLLSIAVNSHVLLSRRVYPESHVQSCAENAC